MSEKILTDIKKKMEYAEKTINRLKKDRDMYQDLIKQLNKEISTSELALSELKQKYNTFSTKAFISDHATLRYLERSGIIDIDELKKALLTDEVLQAIYYGADTIKSNGYEFRIKNGKIVTIIGEQENSLNK